MMEPDTVRANLDQAAKDAWINLSRLQQYQDRGDAPLSAEDLALWAALGAYLDKSEGATIYSVVNSEDTQESFGDVVKNLGGESAS